MMPLPIVARELRVAARHRATYWLRFFLVLLGTVLWFLLLTMLPGGLPFQRAQMVFGAVASLAFVFCLFAGVFLTSDCLSREKREGTVGLLFLTELKGYDVVLGKLLATSIHAVYGLLAIFPVLALAMLIGGVTSAEFWRISLILLATIFFSLSLCMLVSALGHGTRQAMSLSLLVILLVAGAPFLLAMLVGFVLGPGAGNPCAWLSPVFSYRAAFDSQFGLPSGATAFWGSFLAVSLSGVMALGLACVFLPRRWCQKVEPKKLLQLARLQSWIGRARTSFASRGSALDANPFYWLAAGDRLPRVLAWTVFALLLPPWAGLLAGSFTSGLAGTATRVRFSFCAAMVLAFAMHQGLKWLMASEATRRLSEDRANGALELLLVTPLSVPQIIEGQRRALRRLFLGPVLAALAVNGVLFRCLANHPAIGPRDAVIGCELCVCGALLLLADLHGLSWIGLRMAFQSRQHQSAICATLARVLLLPWLAILLLALLIMGGAALSFELCRVLTVLWSALAAVLVLSMAARAKEELLGSFRQFSSETEVAALSAGATAPVAFPAPLVALASSSTGRVLTGDLRSQ